MRYILLLGFALSSYALDVSTSLFPKTTESVYSTWVTATAGPRDYISFASAVNFTGELHIQGGASVLNVQLKNVQLGLYNGEWEIGADINLRRKRSLNSVLAPLSENFSVELNNGKVKSVTINKNIPSWAKTVQKRIAQYLQLDLANIDLAEASVGQTNEESIIGSDSNVSYMVIPGANSNHTQVIKSNSADQCKKGRRTNARTLLNSAAVYDLERVNNTLLVKRINAQDKFGKFNAILKTENPSGSVTSSS